MAAAGPITVISWAEFIADPPLMHGLFAPQPGKVVYDPARVYVLLGDQESCRQIQVNSLEDLVRVKREILSKPLVYRVYAEHSKTENYAVVRVTTRWKADLALLLNTRHPMVASALQEKFEDAERCMQKGEQFCIEFDIGPSLEHWYKDMLEDTWDCSRTRTKTKYTRFYITNHTKYQHCFDCNEIWCVLCNLCWLSSAPCYMIHRQLTCVDIQHQFENIPIVMRTPVSSGHIVEIMPEGQERPERVQTQDPRQEEEALQAFAHNMRPMAPPTYSEATQPQVQQMQGAVISQPVGESGMVFPAAPQVPLQPPVIHSMAQQGLQPTAFQQSLTVNHENSFIPGQETSQYRMDMQAGQPWMAPQHGFPSMVQQPRPQPVIGQQPGQQGQVLVGQQQSSRMIGSMGQPIIGHQEMQPVISQQLAAHVMAHNVPSQPPTQIDCITGQSSIA